MKTLYSNHVLHSCTMSRFCHRMTDSNRELSNSVTTVERSAHTAEVCL